MPVDAGSEGVAWTDDLERDRHGPSRRSRARRALPPVRVAAVRIVRRPSRTAVVATGVALAVATLVGISSGSLVMRDRVLHRELAAVPAEKRAFRVDDFGLASTVSPSDGTAATRTLGLVSRRTPVHALAFAALRFQSHVVVLSAIAGAHRWLDVHSGRAPGKCRPVRCEVVVVGAARLPRELTTPGLRLVPVGHASLVAPALLGGYATPSAATLLVASDVRGLASQRALESNFRTESWVAPLEPRDIHVWDAPGLLDRAARAQSQLEHERPALRLSGPDDAVLAGVRDGTIGSRRLLLVGGEIAALLLGFAVLAAVGLRRTLSAEWRRLEERGARRWQLWLLVTAETGAAALAGVAAGAVLGAAAGSWTSARAGVGADAVLSHSLLTSGTALLVAVAWAVATAVLVVSVRSPARGTRVGPVRIGDAVALGALAGAVLVASRGGASADELASEGSAPLLLLFPGLVSLAAALIAARVLAPLLRLSERAVRGRTVSIRLAVLALARGPSRAAVAVSFLVVSLGLALLASSYRATLERGVNDESSYQVPLDFALTEGARNIGPLDAAALDRYRSIAPGVQAYPVLRRFGDVPSIGTEFTSPVVLGLDPEALAGVHGWRPDFGRLPPTGLARLLGTRKVRLAGPRLPRGTTGFVLPVHRFGAEVQLALDIAEPSGKVVSVDFAGPGSPPDAGSSVPRAGRVVGLEISLTRRAAAAIAHREAVHSVGGPSPEGLLELGPLVALSGRQRLGVVTGWRGWIGRSGARRVSGAPAAVRFALTEGQTAVFRPREPTDGHPLPVVVSPDVQRSAAPGGIVTLEFGTQHVTARIAAVARRFPGTADGDGSFVLADESHLQTVLDADDPGTGRPIEVWLSVPSGAVDRVETALRGRPFSVLDIASRRVLARELRGDPLSRSIEISLGIGALVALGLAVCSLWLTQLGDVADERGDLYDLEAQGATPADLRGQLRRRIAILAALGVVGGVVLGLVLANEVVRLLQVSVSGAAPVPPLVREVGWLPSGVALAVAGVVAACLSEVTVRRAFRESAPTVSGEIE
jgi:hypothetical protein